MSFVYAGDVPVLRLGALLLLQTDVSGWEDGYTMSGALLLAIKHVNENKELLPTQYATLYSSYCLQQNTAGSLNSDVNQNDIEIEELMMMCSKLEVVHTRNSGCSIQDSMRSMLAMVDDVDAVIGPSCSKVPFWPLSFALR